MSETSKKKCSIESCKEPPRLWSDLLWGPYCFTHEALYRVEWATCNYGAGCGRWSVNTHDRSGSHCSLHGGTDYTPRTREEGESSTPASFPCIVCGVPISGSTRDAEPWAFEGERGHKEGQVHSGCRGFVEERRGQG